MCSILICTLAFQSHVAAAEPVDFGRDIKPFFKERCYACHGAVKQNAGLRLDFVHDLISPNSSGRL